MDLVAGPTIMAEADGDRLAVAGFCPVDSGENFSDWPSLRTIFLQIIPNQNLAEFMAGTIPSAQSNIQLASDARNLFARAGGHR